MTMKSGLIAAIVMIFFGGSVGFGNAAESASVLEKSMSDTLDIWREGRYEQLFEQLAHRGKTSRETFVKKMTESTIHPVCCTQKIENFKVLNEKRTEATVYAKIGLEGGMGSPESATREFKLTHQEGAWKMQLSDVLAIAGITGKKKVNATKRHSNRTSFHSM